MKLFTRRYNRPGSSPGLPTTLAAPDAGQSYATLLDFNDHALKEMESVDPATVRAYAASHNVTWLHVQGEPSLELLQVIEKTYNAHSLSLEDVMHGGQRPKIEASDDTLFAVMIAPRMDNGNLGLEQVAMFLGKNFVITIHSGAQDIMAPIRARIRRGQGTRIRQRGPDYLFYAIMDLVIDMGFPVLESLGDTLETLEDQVFTDADAATLEAIHGAKRMMVALRRSVWPQREVLNALVRDDHGLIEAINKPYFRDGYDHVIQIIELIESYRDVTAGLHDMYMSMVSNRMNDVMKVLTIIGTIFIPLSFFTGLYGMNFDTSISPWNMPELAMYYGYPVMLALMGLTVAGMLWFFHRKKWF